jgi:ABC-2 type transport system ATP-binding protein
MTRDPAIEIRGLRVVRGGQEVLPGIDVSVARGSVTGLLGPSGSGKTTLMRAIVGVQIVASGTVTVLGEPAGSPGLRRRVGYVTQAPSVYGDLTVGENLAYFAAIVGASPQLVARTLETVQLGPLEARIVSTTSGGQRARVSLATALLAEPDVLVLDEPTVGLDPVLREDLWRAFHDLAAAGTTLLVSSHVMDEADRCESLLLLRAGHIVATGSPAELRERTDADDVGEAFLRLIREDER